MLYDTVHVIPLWVLMTLRMTVSAPLRIIGVLCPISVIHTPLSSQIPTHNRCALIHTAGYSTAACLATGTSLVLTSARYVATNVTDC